ncbi:MAG: RcnB family protein [Xanthomonadaceae bacterium]|nr:RcnB family protein [Xanthomonadaceae bacterium]MDE1965376.1 RcnB family protein [Xanthomonadaceae bacterium]
MKLLSSMLIAAALVTCSGLAVAQPDHDDHGWHDQDHGRGRDHGRDHDRGDDRDRRDDRHDGHWDDDHGRGHGRGHDRDWVPPGHRWERGHRYDGPVYVVHDYREYRLRPPPRGYHWVRADDGQYLLIGIATGIILDQVLH